MRYAFHPEALAEFEAAADFYSERQAGLEIRFIDAVQSAIRRICGSPERWSIFDGEIRRILVHVFPYAVLYVAEPGCIYIIAIMHCSRQPGYWKTRGK
jgi:plasmid stabilization system protein ParE